MKTKSIRSYGMIETFVNAGELVVRR